MQMIAMVIPLLALLGITACAIKLAAAMLRYRVRWLHAFVFSIVVAALSMAVQGVSPRLGLVAGLLIGVSLELSLGAWFFGARGQRRTGETLGLVGGALLVGLAQVLLAAVGLTLILGVQALRH